MFNFRCLLVFLTGILWLTDLSPLVAQEVQNLKARREKLEKNIARNQQLIQEIGREEKNHFEKWLLLNRQKKKRTALLEELTLSKRRTEKKIKEIEIRIEETKKRIAILTEEFGGLLRKTHRFRLTKPTHFFLLSATGINDVVLRWRYIRQIAKTRKRQFQHLISLKESLDKDLLNLEVEKESLQATLGKMEAEVLQLKKDAEKLDDIVKKLKKQKKSVNKKLNNQRKERDALNAKIAEIIKAASAGRTSSNIDEALSKDFEKNKGKLPWPIDQGVVLRGIGTHAHPLEKDITVINNGVDIRVGNKRIVHAIFDGEVFAVVKMQGYNHVIGIQHGIYTSIYTARMKEIHVKPGDKVRAGQKIGQLDSSSEESVKKFHFELWKDKKVLDPEVWLK